MALLVYRIQRQTIGRITTAGVVTEYPLPSAFSVPSGIAAGPDGALWFTEIRQTKSGASHVAGSISEYAIPTASADPAVLQPARIARSGSRSPPETRSAVSTIAGSISEYSIPTPSANPPASPWPRMARFGSRSPAEIRSGSITTGGVIAEAAIPTGSSDPLGIAPGSRRSLVVHRNQQQQHRVRSLSRSGSHAAVADGHAVPRLDTRGSTGPLGGPSIAGGTSGQYLFLRVPAAYRPMLLPIRST